MREAGHNPGQKGQTHESRDLGRTLRDGFHRTRVRGCGGAAVRRYWVVLYDKRLDKQRRVLVWADGSTEAVAEQVHPGLEAIAAGLYQ